jgi:TonB family protein
LWAGAALSGLAHAGLIALALIAPPWLRPHRERPVPVVAVALVTPAAFDAAAAARARPEPAPPPPAPAPAAPAPVTTPAPAAETEPEATAPPSLAPAFDPESPLGLALRPQAADLPAHRPRPRPGPRAPAAAPAAIDAAAAAAAFEAAVRAAVVERLGRPLEGAGGTVRLALILNRDGRLLAARMVAGSGSPPLDRAAVEAARTALLPAMPEAMPNTRATVEVELVFAPSARQGG